MPDVPVSSTAEASFSPLRSKRLYQGVVDQVVTLVLDGRLAPGARLPSERVLAQDLDISRATVREAIAAMEILGMVDIRQGQGIFISTGRSGDAMVLHALTLLQDESPREILEVRRAIESRTAFLAASQRNDARVSEMGSILTFMEKELSESGSFNMESDRNFHLTVAKASGSELLSRFGELALEMTKQRLWLALRSGTHQDPRLPLKYHGEHVAILEAIKSGDPERARQAAIGHLDSVELDTFASGTAGPNG